MTFLAKNLEALSLQRCHLRLIDRLADHVPSDGSRYEVHQTQAGDLSLLVNGVPIHSLLGAQLEARHIVESEFAGKRYAQNLIIGLGLGYLLKATLTAKQHAGSHCKIVVYEPDVDLLHFVLSNVDLSSYLGHPDVSLTHLTTTFFQQMNGQYVQGDGIGVLFTPGYVAAFQDNFETIIGALERNVENAMLNTQMLQTRGKDWTREFLTNTAILAQGKPVDCLKEQFDGQTVVIVGSGPSLADNMEALRQLQGKVVIMAVGGALRALEKGGVTPDFVTFMDYLGPNRHLHGLDQPTRNSHVIVGPSAQNYALQLERKSLWISSLHFNEQFSDSLDQAFGQALLRYHTGGTVSMLTFHIAVDMGFQRFILVGQDLAIRGNLLYADGTQVDVAQGNVLKLAESATTVAHDLKMKQVPGWKEGELLWSPTDYAHYIQHFVNLVPLLKELRPDAELYNCSTGGAYLKGYQHQPLADLLPQLLELPSAQVDQKIEQQWIAAEAQFPQATVSRRLYRQLETLLRDSHECVRLSQQALPMLDRLVQTPPDRWYEPSQAYSGVFNALAELLEGNPFFKETLFHEQLTLYQNYNETAKETAEHLANFQLDRFYMEEVAKVFQQKLIPWLNEALENLEAAYPELKSREINMIPFEARRATC